jgi:hypothetical protein
MRRHYSEQLKAAHCVLRANTTTLGSRVETVRLDCLMMTRTQQRPAVVVPQDSIRRFTQFLVMAAKPYTLHSATQPFHQIRLHV